MKKLLLLIFSSALFACNSMDVEYIEAYEIKVGDAFLFGKLDPFLAEMGLPDSVTAYEYTKTINTKSDLISAFDSLIEKKASIITLVYPGIEMWYDPSEKRVIPFQIDFRKTDIALKYKDVFFDDNFAEEKYKQMFPSSYFPSQEYEIGSLFSEVTKESDEYYSSYLLNRKTKDDPFETPMVEFTFRDGALMYIFFANF